ncbi:MAG: NAD(+) diphosphatase [Velocimicrobium sp.]
MIQDIKPSIFYNEYKDLKPSENSPIFCFSNNKILLQQTLNEAYKLPVFADFSKKDRNVEYIYLFMLDEVKYFLCMTDEVIELPSFEYHLVQIFREDMGKELRFTGITAYHLYQWYRDNRFCGKCGAKLSFSKKERMLFCETCGNSVYPKIAPAIIVGIVNGDKILMTKYAGRIYKKYALVAGFTEIGESLEDTVRREVMEEVGVKVKDITYYKSQPWGFDSNLLVGFFAQLDGSDEITLDTEELSFAGWISKHEMTVENDGISLTNDMMHYFFTH